MVWAFVLLIYSVLLSAVYMYSRRRQLSPLEDELRGLSRSLELVETPKDRASILQALAELRRASIPWHERAISTIGVIAFFSMSIAVVIQTISANLQQARVERLESGLAALKEERAAAERFLAEVSHAVTTGVLDPRALGDVERRVLQYRLDRLRGKLDRDEKETREVYSLAMALGRYDVAAAIMERHTDLFDMARPGDRLSLAEYYYLVGSHEASAQLQRELWKDRLNLARPLARRLIVLGAALDVPLEEAALEMTRVLKVRTDEARQIVLREVEALKTGAQRREISKGSDPRQ